MENNAVQNKYRWKTCIFYSLSLYTVLSILYIAFLYIAFIAFPVENKSLDVAGFAGLLLQNMLFLLLFSFIFGFSLIIFNIRKIPSAAKWTLHILLLYAVTLVTFLLISSGSEDPSQKVLFIFISTVLFAIIYGLAALFVYIYKRKRR